MCKIPQDVREFEIPFPPKANGIYMVKGLLLYALVKLERPKTYTFFRQA